MSSLCNTAALDGGESERHRTEATRLVVGRKSNHVGVLHVQRNFIALPSNAMCRLATCSFVGEFDGRYWTKPAFLLLSG